MGTENAWVNTIGRLLVAARDLSMTACELTHVMCVSIYCIMRFRHDSMPKADGERKVPILSTKFLTSNFSIFYEILTEAQSILSKNTAAKPWRFRDLLRENVNFKAPHNEQEKLRALRPDIVVVRRENLASSPPLYGQFHCVIKHKRGERALHDNVAI
jgi:hypothetical protein